VVLKYFAEGGGGKQGDIYIYIYIYIYVPTSETLRNSAFPPPPNVFMFFVKLTHKLLIISLQGVNKFTSIMDTD